MDSSLILLDDLLRQVVEHLKSGRQPDRRVAALKLDRVAAIATTLSSTIKVKR
jgi:hypothetical protein